MEENRVQRIAEMEARLGRLTAWLKAPAADQLREDVRLLDEYCRSGLWLADFEADEAGELPPELPRGVLSEDALYDALQEYDERQEPSVPQISYDRALQEIPCGRYRHFKGGLYEVLGIARHSETEEPLVVYRPLYCDSGLWCRPAGMWNEPAGPGGTPRFRPEPEGAE